MKKNFIKISLIAFFVLAIGAVFVLFLQGIVQAADTQITAASFPQHIEAEAQQRIKNKDFETASKNYQELLACIRVEASHRYANGTPLISKDDQEEAYRSVVAQYAPIFIEHVLKDFHHSTWSDAQLPAWRNTAQSMLALQVIESGTATEHSLRAIVHHITNYYAAWKVAKSAAYCSTVEGIAQITASARRYQSAPLTYNDALRNALYNVSEVAKSAVVRRIVGEGNHVIRNWAYYGRYEAFSKAYTRVTGRIRSYTSRYGHPGALSQLTSALATANNRAFNYYSEYYPEF